MSNPKPLKFAAVFLIATFLALLVFPMVSTNFHAGPQRSDAENRDLNLFPGLEWNREALDTFPARFEAAFNDHFGWRAQFTRWHALLKLRLFGVSPVEKVVLGKENWLYYGESIKEFRGVKTIRNPKQWAVELRAKRAWLEARGIRYLLVVAPNKEQVYPEHLPARLFRIREGRYVDEILRTLDDDLKECVVDLRKPLVEGKKYGLVFDRTDTHWSHLGAFLSTREIVERLRRWDPQMEPAPLEARPQTPVWDDGGDLARMIGLPHEFREERLTVSPAPVFATGTMRFQQSWPEDSLQDAPMVLENPSKKLTALVIGDSFGKGVMEFLPAHFRRVVRLRPDVPYNAWFQGLLPELIEAEKPDVYLDVLCSRSLRFPPRVTFPGGK